MNVARWIGLLVFYFGLATSALAEAPPLKIGIIPYLTPNVLMALFQPLRQQLAKDLGRPVELFTAPDVRSFAKRTLKPDFDIVITAAHQARLAQLEGGYLPLAHFSGPLHAAIVVSRNSPLQQLSEFRGRRIAVTDRSILVNIAMNKILAEQGIGEKDIQYIPVNSQNTGILTVARGDADGAIIAHFALDQSPVIQRERVRSIFQSGALPNITILASPQLDPEQRSLIQKALLSLPNTPEGSAFLEGSRFVGILPADDVFMKALDVYLPETRKQLGL